MSTEYKDPLARHVLLKTENPQAFELHKQDILSRLQPADDLELGIVETIIHGTWRHQRMLEVETALIEIQMHALDPECPLDKNQNRLTLAKVFIRQGEDIAETIDRVSRMQNHLDRMVARAYRTLTLVRRNFPAPDVAQTSPSVSPNTPQPAKAPQPPDAPKHKKQQNEPRTQSSRPVQYITLDRRLLR